MPLFERTIAKHKLRAHLNIDTGSLDWKHLAAIVIAFHTHKLCVRMHFFTVPCGEIFVVTLMNAVASPQFTAAFLFLASLCFVLMDVVGGFATGLGLALSYCASMWLKNWALGLTSSVNTAVALVSFCSFMASFGTIPISHGYFERGSDDSDLDMEVIPNIISKMLIPFNTKLEMLYAMRLYSNTKLWRPIDAMAKEMYLQRKVKPHPNYPMHDNKTCLLTLQQNRQVAGGTM